MNILKVSSSSYDKYNDQLLNKINTRMKQKFHSKMGIKLHQYQQLKKQLKVFKQKMFTQNKYHYINKERKYNIMRKSSQTQNYYNNDSKTMYQPEINQDKKQEYHVTEKKKIRRLIFHEKKLTVPSIDKNQVTIKVNKQDTYQKRGGMSPLQLKMFRKSKRNNISLSSINSTLPVKTASSCSRSRKKVKSQLKSTSPYKTRQKTDSAFDNQYQCKINTEQLIDLVKQQQIKEYNKRCLDRLSNDKNKVIYQQAISKIYQIARQKLKNKKEYQIPKELGINKIYIPKRIQKKQSPKRTSYLIPNYQRQGYQWQKKMQKKRDNEHQKIKNDRQQKLKRRKIDKINRNRTECLIYRNNVYEQRHDDNINGWQYENINSRQLLI